MIDDEHDTEVRLLRRASEGKEPVAGDPASLAGALHEVSNALTVVLGWLAEARSLTTEDSSIGQALDVAYLHAKRGHSVARDAIGARRADPVGIRGAISLLRDAARAARPEALKRAVELKLAEDEGDFQVANWDVALQILVNLLLNALAFSPRGGSVELSLAQESQRVVFRVVDQGPGVPENMRSDLFSGGRSRRPGGAGIGLAHSYALARSAGGELRLGPTQGVGACFELEWPTTEAPSQTVSQRPVMEGIGGMRVVVLEDDPAVMSMVEFGLGSRGVEVVAAVSEEELTNLPVQRGPFDAALVDLSPIKRDPAGAIAAFKRRHGPVPVVLISGTAVAETLNLPLSGWVEKPFELGELYAALASLRSEAAQKLA